MLSMRADIDFREKDMDMAVDQARHQRAAAAIDDIGLGGLDRLVGEFADGFAFDEEFIALAQLAMIGFEQGEILEVQCGHRKSPPGSRTSGGLVP
jgi:hypothetical protein